MKIAHIVPTYLPATRYGGTISSVHGLCKAMAERGNEVHVFTTNVDGPKDSPVPLGKPVDLDGVKVWYFPCGEVDRGVWGVSRRIARRIYYSGQMGVALKEKIHEFDLLHLHSIFLWPTGCAAKIAKETGTPYLVSPRGMLVKKLFQRKNRWAKWAWFCLLGKQDLEVAAGIHFTSELELKEAKRFGLNFRKSFVVPNGIDLLSTNFPSRDPEISADPLIRRDDTPKILFLGRINWKKGLDLLINSMVYIPRAQLIIAGNNEENYQIILENLARQRGVLSRLIFTGPVFGSGKYKLLKSADLFVLPSYSENFGISVLEAMAVGCPVVVTPEVGLADVVKETDCGLVVRGEPEILGREIKNLLGQKEKLSAMGKRGQEAAGERFSWEVVGKEMEKVYGTLHEESQRVHSRCWKE